MEQSQPPTTARKAPSSKPRQATGSPALAGLLPAKSMDRADSVFKTFSASRFPNGSESATHVDSGDEPAVVHAVQRRLMTQHLDRLDTMDLPNRGLTLALPESVVETSLPSLNAKASTIELNDVLKIIAQHMRGTEFYANGNAVLNRLVLRSRAQEFVAAIKQQAASGPHEPESASQSQKARTVSGLRSRGREFVAVIKQQAASRAHDPKSGAPPQTAKAAPQPQGAAK